MRGIKKFRQECDEQNKLLSNKELLEKLISMLEVDNYSSAMEEMSLNENESIELELKIRLEALGFFKE